MKKGTTSRMKSDADRIDTLDTIAENAALLGNLAGVILPDIHAACGEPEQERHTRPRLLEDMRDLPPDALERAMPLPDPKTIDYSDPTGDRAVKPDPASRDLAELDKRLRRARGDIAVVTAIFQRHQAARTPGQIKDVRIVAEGELDPGHGDEWCSSHLRVAVLEPVETRKSGEHAGKPYYKGMCRQCGELLAGLKSKYPKRFRNYKLPPIELVGISTYRKLRASDIEALVSPQHKDRKKDRNRPGDDRKRKTA